MASEILNVYLHGMVELGASDLFLMAGAEPAFRVDGALTRGRLPLLTDAQMAECFDELLTPMAAERFAASPDVDLAYTLPGVGRYRVNLFMTQGRRALVARAIPLGAVEFGRLNLPASILRMAEKQSGIILVVGPTGCGKSTTLAAMIHHLNVTAAEHIVTIEDPIEFVHEDIKSLVHQRQVGFDTKDFATALRHVVRQDPDTILIGEMRDRDTMETAINAALTGHLVLSTLHTASVAQSIDRMLNYFDPGARPQVQADLAVTLVGIAAMRLLPRKDGGGRVPAVEVLTATPTVRRILAEGAWAELYDVMKRGKADGMQTMNQSLLGLANAGLVDPAVALRESPNREELKLNLQGMFTGIDSIDLRTEKRKEDERK
ncbi:MAG: Twitching mobility protein [Phycisphaerae bacterium]|nr:Twitching mobility protein [Phycisphaerae bacterium]